MADQLLEPVLDIKGVYEALKGAGYNVTFRSVQRLASEKKLPFKRGPDNKTLFIKASDLRKAMDVGLYPDLRDSSQNKSQRR